MGVISVNEAAYVQVITIAADFIYINFAIYLTLTMNFPTYRKSLVTEMLVVFIVQLCANPYVVIIKR